MKKLTIFFALALFILPTIFATNLTVEKLSSGEVMISNLNKITTFDLNITNEGEADTFEIFNLVGFSMSPIEIQIGDGETKNIQMEVSPVGEFSRKGYYTLNYFLRNSKDVDFEEQLTFKVIELAEAFEIKTEEIDPNSNLLKFSIQNKYDVDFGEANVKLTSAFFEVEGDMELGPNEKKELEVQLDKEEFKDLFAGYYTLTAKITVDGITDEVEGTIKFSEEEIVSSEEKNYGFLVRTKVITKSNEGNVPSEQEVTLKKNILSRAFTTVSPEPNSVEREGATIYYNWKQEVEPGEELEISIKTNWLLPLIVIALILSIVVLAKKATTKTLAMRKKVSFVKANGGEFALKVTLFVKARKYLERINISDRLPPLVKLYHKFSGEEPLRASEKSRKIDWHFEKLEEGEIRTMSYIIYSKIGVLGKFVLPAATAIFERNGKIKESTSNQAFFVAEQRRGELEE